MSTNERKQANFSVSHVWPEMIDIKCCNCKKFSESLKNGEFEKSGEKSYIIKKQVTCNCCGASAPAGTELEEVYVDADTPVKNTVASVLQVYAIINAICGLFLALRMADDYYSGAAGFLLFGISCKRFHLCPRRGHQAPARDQAEHAENREMIEPQQSGARPCSVPFCPAHKTLLIPTADA